MSKVTGLEREVSENFSQLLYNLRIMRSFMMSLKLVFLINTEYFGIYFVFASRPFLWPKTALKLSKTSKLNVNYVNAKTPFLRTLMVQLGIFPKFKNLIFYMYPLYELFLDYKYKKLKCIFRLFILKSLYSHLATKHTNILSKRNLASGIVVAKHEIFVSQLPE